MIVLAPGRGAGTARAGRRAGQAGAVAGYGGRPLIEAGGERPRRASSTTGRLSPNRWAGWTCGGPVLATAGAVSIAAS
jgi:hypothetical protein